MANVKKSIIKDSVRIRKLLKERFVELELSAKGVIEDAKEKSMVFTSASLSKYLKHGNIPCSLSEENIIWLCFRWGIPINLYIGKAVLQDSKLRFVVPEYNEENCLLNLKKLFPYEINTGERSIEPKNRVQKKQKVK